MAELIGRKRQYWREADAREALEELSRSKLSLAAFARGKGVSTERLRFWKKRLGAEGRAIAPAFVGITLPPRETETSDGSRRADIEIVIGSVLVRVREEIPVEKLAVLVAALNRQTQEC
jgi:hypothetical protein